MASDLPFSSTFRNIPTPGQLDGHFASLDEVEADTTSPWQDTILGAIIRRAVADANNFAEKFRNKPRNKYEAFRARLESNRTKWTRGTSHDEIQWHLKRDLDTLRELQANILRNSHSRWTCVNHDAKQKGYILCFVTAVNEEDGKGIVVVQRRPLSHARCLQRMRTDVDRCPSRRMRLQETKLSTIR